MTDRLIELRSYFIAEKMHHQFRTDNPVNSFTAQMVSQKSADIQRAVKRLCYMLEQETPVVLPNEKIALLRTCRNLPELFSKEENEALRTEHFIWGEVNNISVDYSEMLSCGFGKKELEIRKALVQYEKQKDIDKIKYLQGMLEILDAVRGFAARYQKAAIACGNTTVADSFSRIPENPPETFLEALQMLRLLHFTMWLSRSFHNTLGRFDQYMYPYFKQDIEQGRISREEALELVEEFFLSCNRDSDLYQGIQLGDNGQSLMLGGLGPDGRDRYNELSEICLNASLEMNLIDPKINLRVHRNTSKTIYDLAARLTKQGLGFPQYSNDDIVIPALKEWGYAEEDAYNYTVAACWEFIVPGRAMDIPNIDALDFASAVYQATVEELTHADTFAEWKEQVRKRIGLQADLLTSKFQNVYMYPAPFLSLMMEGCIEQAKDISLGAQYNNYGLHGTGISTAADSMAAIQKHIFQEQDISKEELLQAMASNYEGYEELQYKLKFDSLKMGNNDDMVDQIAAELLDTFAEALQHKRNDRGGIYRAGTGSAMYYVWHGRDLPATPDGRRQGEGLSANYSPSPLAKCKGPVSIIQSFVKPNLKKVCNGGPLTLELHDTVFRTPEAIGKTAYMIKSFIDMGGHQLQLNTVNRDTLLDAQKHPEKYRNLIVRVWGWSGYFVELDQEYQEHIIQRAEYVV